MVICSAEPLPLNVPVDRFYEGPQTEGHPVPCRLVALREATREEYVKCGYEMFGDKFEESEDLSRGWVHYYLVSMD